jgi:palmitoyl transferase
MKIFFRSLCILLFIYSLSSQASDQSLNASKQPQWLRSSYHRLKQIWQEGDIELYLTGYAWHNRYTYSADRIKTYNENAWGGGLGKSFLDEKGNRHDLYAFAFLESHKKVEPIAGYAYLKVFSYQ